MELLLGGKGKVSIYVILEKEYIQSSALSCYKVMVSKEEQIPSLMILMLLKVWEDAITGIHKISF